MSLGVVIWLLTLMVPDGGGHVKMASHGYLAQYDCVHKVLPQIIKRYPPPAQAHCAPIGVDAASQDAVQDLVKRCGRDGRRCGEHKH